MKILHCIPSMGGGGAERQLTYLCDALVRRGHEVAVCVIYRGPNVQRLVDSGARVHWIRCVMNYDPRIYLQIARIVREWRPDVVQTWMLHMDVLGGMAATAAGVPWVLSERCSAAMYPGTWKDRLRIRRGESARAIVANSDAGADYWRGHIGADAPISVIRNVVPVDEVAIAEPLSRALLGVGEDERLVVYAGRFGDQKNVVNLIDGLIEACRQAPTLRAILYGDGPLHQDLARRVYEAGLNSRIRLSIYSASLWRVLRAADMFISVSLFEGTPNTVLEAASAGCPVLVSDIPEHREFLSDDEARFVDPHDPASIARGLVAMVTEGEAARSRAARARAKVEQWTLAEAGRHYEALYQSIVSGARH